jgi:glc operon protein GlcG
MDQPAAPPPPLPYGPPISLASAKQVLAAAEAEATAQGWSAVIAICDSTGQLAALHRMDQSNLGAVELAQRKARTAARFRRPTKVYEDLVASGPSGVRLLSVSDEIIALEGGLPLVQSGAVVGAIGVSGMQSFQDGQVAAAGVRALP